MARPGTGGHTNRKKMNQPNPEIVKLSDSIRRSTNPDEVARLAGRIAELVKNMPTGHRKAEFSEDDADLVPGRRAEGRLTVRSFYERPSRSDEHRETAQDLDHLYILGTLLKKDPRKTRYFAERCDDNPALRQLALDTSSGADWIPTEFTSEFHRKVRLSLKVAALLEQVQMPTATYKLPVEGNDARARVVAERSGVDDELDTTKRVQATLTTPGLRSVTLSAVKTGCRVVTSAELTEDSIVPMLPYLSEKLSRALAEAWDDAAINGKVGGSHLDSDVTDTDDVRKAWFNGFRVLASGASFANGKAVIQASTAGTLDVADLRKCRARMGRYGVNPQDVVIVTGAGGYAKLLSLRDGNGSSPVMTMDKFGNNATIVTGQLASLDGSPVIVNEFVREDLSHSGVYDGVTTDSTLVFLVNRRQFVVGRYRNPQLRSQEIISTDQVVLVGLQRGDMKPFQPTDPACSYVYDVRLI
jgi:HK97 family phage major capsid protein